MYGVNMSKFAKVALCALSMGFAAPAFAVSFDVATMTCTDFAGLDADTKGILIMWMDGYTGGENGDSTFDADRLKVNADDADKACTADPTRSLLEVMSEVVAQ